MRRIIHVKVIASAKTNKVTESGEGFKVYLTAPPLEGKANKLLIKLLAQHFDVKKSQLSIARGEKSREKLIALTDLGQVR